MDAAGLAIVSKSPSIAELAKALVKVQAILEGAKKDSTNPHLKNKYADLASCWAACRKPLSDNGLAVIQCPSSEGDRVSVTTILVHASGEFIEFTLSLKPMRMDAQQAGSAITYARRYSLCAVVGIAPEDDDAQMTMNADEPRPRQYGELPPRDKKKPQLVQQQKLAPAETSYVPYENDVYTGSDLQKKVMVGIAKEYGIHLKEDWMQLSDAMKGKLVSELPDLIPKWKASREQ